jgi:hypothetical protein
MTNTLPLDHRVRLIYILKLAKVKAKWHFKLFFETLFLAIHSFDELKQLPDEAASHKKRF